MLRGDTIQDGSRMPRWVAVALVALCAACLVLVISWSWIGRDMHLGCTRLLAELFSQRSCTASVGKILTYSWMLAFLPFMLLLELWRPADPTQPLFSPGLLVDGMWFVAFPVLGVWLPDRFDQSLQAVFGPLLSGLRLQWLATLPLAMQFVVVILISDFLAWFSHYVRHKNQLMWEFHKIHHSQVQLNYFSTRRLHPLDLFANSLIRFLPWTLLGLNVAIPGYLIWTTFLRLFEMFVHSNIRTNLGPLRFVIVTPQTHRIHHSLRPEHVDRNFGNFLSIWDFMFHTQSMDFDVYPALGVSDTDCPRGVATTVGGALRMLGRELAYPLRIFGASFRRSRAKAPEA
jgi:sterol desaturase/sphingolipid hydroxylase (fatty acid hydroxylase superfamily)